MVEGPDTLAYIDALLGDLRRAREKLDADIAALERTRELLAGKETCLAALERKALCPQGQEKQRMPAQGAPSPSCSVFVSYPSSHQDSWHDAVLDALKSGAPRSVSEIHEAVMESWGVTYDAVAKWLLRSTHTGKLAKAGRGQYRLAILDACRESRQEDTRFPSQWKPVDAAAAENANTKDKELTPEREALEGVRRALEKEP